MSKETSAFSIIIFLFIILVAWWAVSSFKIPQHTAATLQHSTLDGSFLAQRPVSIFHASVHGIEMYSGAMNIPSCDDFLSGITASNGAPARLRLIFTITRPIGGCDNSTHFVSVPFSVTYSSTQEVHKPILDSVKINNEAAAFSVVEASN